MELSNKLMYALLGLAALMLVGMLTASWRAILYPLLLIMGISVLFSFVRELPHGRRPLLIAGPFLALFLLFFVVLDAATGFEPTASTDYVLGMTPATAFYLLGFPPLVVLTGLLYAVTFTREDADPQTLEQQDIAAEEPGDGGNG